MSLVNQLESLLFITNRPMSAKHLAELTNQKKEVVILALAELKIKYSGENSGVWLSEINQEYQLITNSENTQLISEFIKEETTGELTPAQLEALTVVAYRGPISKAELEIIRGVNCTLILRNLMIRGLVENVTDKKLGTVLYNVTFDFLKHLGLASIKELPDYEKLNSDDNLKKLLEGMQQQAEVGN
ncbi:MAG: SMC-Scp complex subunit ScpB [Candidatus Buchananbacteria bacterium]